MLGRNWNRTTVPDDNSRRKPEGYGRETEKAGEEGVCAIRALGHPPMASYDAALSSEFSIVTDRSQLSSVELEKLLSGPKLGALEPLEAGGESMPCIG